MSRSYQHYALRNKFKEAYWAAVCYFSNKKDKKLANQRFRTKNKHLIKKLMKEDPDEINFHYRLREISNTWDFSSDGLAYHHYIDTDDKTFIHKLTNK